MWKSFCSVCVGVVQRSLDCIFPTRLPTHRPSQSLGFRIALSALHRGSSTYTSLFLAWPEPAMGSVLPVW